MAPTLSPLHTFLAFHIAIDSVLADPSHKLVVRGPHFPPSTPSSPPCKLFDSGLAALSCELVVGDPILLPLHTSPQAAIDSGLADPSRVSVVGGSHGGFLTGHLLGQHPDTFKAGVLRNPGEGGKTTSDDAVAG